jgi:uncharacterized protein with GYD domain
MPFYLATFSYTPEAWSRLINKPEDRREVARALAEGIGGKLHGFWYAFGDYDGLLLFEAPNNAAAGAVAARALSGGALKSYATTVLFTVEEAVEMLKQAQHLTYQPPGGSTRGEPDASPGRPACPGTPISRGRGQGGPGGSGRLPGRP